MVEAIQVQRPDRGRIAVWPRGQGPGPALVLVHGSMTDHTAFDPLVAAFDGRIATYAMDRRGFGESPETGSHSAGREFDDVAAVVDAVAERTGGPVVLFGHSWGASCGMGGAARTKNLRQLLLYEPSLGPNTRPASLNELKRRWPPATPKEQSFRCSSR